MQVGSQIVQIRDSICMSRVGLAKQSGVEESTLSRVERDIGLPSKLTLHRVLNAFERAGVDEETLTALRAPMDAYWTIPPLERCSVVVEGTRCQKAANRKGHRMCEAHYARVRRGLPFELTLRKGDGTCATCLSPVTRHYRGDFNLYCSVECSGKRRYGLSAQSYQSLLEAHAGRCGACGRSPRLASSLHVDHCHETKLVRGMLCNLCNLALGSFRDDPVRLDAAARYLLDPVAPKVRDRMKGRTPPEGVCRLCSATFVVKPRGPKIYCSNEHRRFCMGGPRARGVSPEHFSDVLAYQIGACAICSSGFDFDAKMPRRLRKQIHLDHCHETDVFRGILCQQCNIGLGATEDSQSRIKMLSRYLTDGSVFSWSEV